MKLKPGTLCMIVGCKPNTVGFPFMGKIVSLVKTHEGVHRNTGESYIGWFVTPEIILEEEGRNICWPESYLFPIDGGDLSKEENVFSTKPISLDKTHHDAKA